MTRCVTDAVEHIKSAKEKNEVKIEPLNPCIFRRDTPENVCFGKVEGESNNTDSLKVISYSALTTQELEQLEWQLKVSENKRLHAVAFVEANQEKQSTLESTIKDMELLIKDLKSKGLKVENQTESVEGKCFMLSDESNAELC
ncbi:WPP domain-interacting protein 2 [Striga asiatica]|uniref:WPP domain-interacting protein 2 n=1 Tax=Striga asiatica TaxID=4170 RepID=A0A5A7QWB9_STRAF|nr:WPP domain-interacting protein 2 [Striga asiatica]